MKDMTAKSTGIHWFTSLILVVATLATASAETPKNLLDQMNSDQFEARNSAYVKLRKWSQENIKTAPEQLYKAWKSSPYPEVRSRCHELMKETVIQRKFGKGRGFVGIRMEEFVVQDKDRKEPRAGVRITLVMPKTPAEKSGLKINDVVLGVDKLDFGKATVQRQGALRMEFGTVTRFSDYIQSKQPDETITLHILRNGKKMEIKVTLMKRPASADVDAFGRRVFDQRKEKQEFFDLWMKSMRSK